MNSSPRPEPVGDGDDDATASSVENSAVEASSEVAGGGAVVGESEPETGEGETGPDPLRFSNWMKRSATGAVMSGIAVGLKEALQPKQPIPFVIEAGGEPEDPDKPIDLKFDPDSPAATVAIIRRPPVVEDPQPPAPPS